MSEDFFTQPILNSPYEYPGRHWALDDSGQPTGEVKESRRSVSLVTPIPKPKKSKKKGKAEDDQGELVLDEGKGLSTEDQQYDPTGLINELRRRVDQWRAIPDPADWKVTPETQRLLEHWRHHQFSNMRPFFCQVEAVETLIWLTEVAPQLGKEGKVFLDHLDDANEAANPGLARVALKLATGAGDPGLVGTEQLWRDFRGTLPMRDR